MKKNNKQKTHTLLLTISSIDLVFFISLIIYLLFIYEAKESNSLLVPRLMLVVISIMGMVLSCYALKIGINIKKPLLKQVNKLKETVAVTNQENENLKDKVKSFDSAMQSMSDINASNSAFAVSRIVEKTGSDDYEKIYNELEKNSILVDNTMMNVKHVIATPLSGIALCLKDIENNIETDTAIKKIRLQLETIENNVKALRRDVGVIEDKNVIDLGKEMEARVHYGISSSVKYLHLEFTCEETIMIKARKFKNIMLCASCIFENAVYFSRDNGKIKISVEKESDNIEIKIINYGPHMKDPDKIFINGYSSKGTSGRGLAIAKEQAEKMHGHISGENLNLEKPDIGVRFTISIPIAEVQ